MPVPSERPRAGGREERWAAGPRRECRAGRQRPATTTTASSGRAGRRVAALLLFAGGALSAAACHDSSAPSPKTAYLVAVDAGDLQLAPAGSHVAAPLAVRVTDASHAPVKGVPVRFRIVAGAGAQLDDSAAVTDIDGIARVELTVGPTPLDTVRVFAFVPGQESRGVTLRVIPVSPPSLTSVLPASFGAGDTLLLGGANLGDPATTTTEVLFGAVPGRVLGVGTGGGIQVIVPPCVTPGAVQVRLVVGTAPAVTVAGTYVADAGIALAPLEGTTIPASSVAGCVNLPGDGARYLLVPNYALGTSRTPTPFVLGASGVVAAALAARPAVAASARGGARERFDHLLRVQGQQLAGLAAANARSGAGEERGLALAALTLGSTRTFRVYGDLNGNTFKSSTATLKFIGTNVLLYLDNESPAGGFSDAEITRFGKLFDETLYGIDVRAFGSESDIDKNGHVIMLLSPRVNELTPNDPQECALGIIVGFFTSYDLASKSTNSNQGEVFYSVVPDPQGTRGCPISLTRARELIPATFIHEFQHMISYNQHVLVRGGESGSEWMSHMAEELGSLYYERKYPSPQGRTDPAQLFPDSSQAFILGDLQNAFQYMNTSAASSVTNFTGAGSLDERGGAWLFLRWLADQKGNDILGRIEQSGDTGKTNIARKAGEDFARLFGDFSIALYTDSLPGVARGAIPPRYRFTTRNWRQIFNRLYSLGAPDITAPFPISPKPIPFNGSVSGSMGGGTMDFYSLTTPAGSGSVSLQFQHDGNPPTAFDAKLGAQLGIFRLPAAAGP